MNLNGKTVVVIGAGSGIGRAVAVDAANAGATLILRVRTHVANVNRIALCACLSALAFLIAGDAAATPAPPIAVASAVAVRTTQPVVIDGRADDAIWHTAPVIADFTEFVPVEGGPARFRTEAQAAFDDHALYVFIRAFDPEPSKISTALARRDVRPPDADQLKIVIDAFHDRRSGFEFAVSPGGTKRDYAVYDDNVEVGSWDGVWDVSTRVDSLGWTAEFAIPFSQLRYASSPTHTFGFAIWRDLERYKERISWPAYRPSQIGFISQLGDLTGIDGIPAPRRFDVTPYTVAKNDSRPAVASFDRHQSFHGGADFKYGLTSNFTLDGTVAPDFGQVEQDPAVLNLSVFETFLQEKRPFFLEGTGVYQFAVNSNQVNSSGEGLFYSRRIGRAPQLADPSDASSPTSTTIVGAAKLTGRSAGGLTIGALEAVTQREAGSSDRTIEPATNYGVVRLQQDLNDHKSAIGLIVTAVDRSVDGATRDALRRSAYVVGLDARHQFGPGHNYQLNAAVTASRIDGDRTAILATETNPTHYYQRPDGKLTVDSTRTSLTGDTETLHFAKYGGGIFVFETSYQRISPGYEINDLGFLNRADWQDQSTWAGLQFLHRTRFYDSLNWYFNEWQDWTSAGDLLLDRAVNTNGQIQFHNNSYLHIDGTIGRLGRVFNDRATRGGPALRLSPGAGLSIEVQGDARRALYPDVFTEILRTDEGRTRRTFVNPSLQVRVSSRTTQSLGLNWSHNRDNTQFFGNFVDGVGVTHHTFAHLDQKTIGLTFRVDYTASPTLTLQVYANPFVSKGTYSDVREVANARAGHYADRFVPYGDAAVTSDPGGFNFKAFNSSTVLRWEYRPGSSLYVVWTQGREDGEPVEGTRNLSGDFDRLFRVHPANTFLVKVAHLFDW